MTQRKEGVRRASAFHRLSHSLKSQLGKDCEGRGAGRERAKREISRNPRHGSVSHSGSDWSRHDRILCCSMGDHSGTGKLSVGKYFENFNPETLSLWDPLC